MKKLKEFEIADVVKSVSGRDKNRFYLITGIFCERVEICDGDLHKTEKPKKKNLKHIRYAGECSSDLKEKLRSGKTVFDCEIRKELKEYENQ